MPPGRSKEQVQADTLNDVALRLISVRNELDPTYSPPEKKPRSAIMELIDFLNSCIMGLLGLGILAALVVFTAAVVSAIIS